MPVDTSVPSLEEWLSAIRERICRVAPELLRLFEDYAGEARFGRELIESYLLRLPRGADILEIGAGMLLLSCQLQNEGFKVTALEPVGDGFSHFRRLQNIVFDLATERGTAPIMRSISAEVLDYEAAFDFAFSINVMEHVSDVAVVLRRVLAAVKSGGCYFFVCPNYTFPYEPHFNLPTLGSKHLTEHFLGRLIFASTRVADAIGTWASLNWITVTQVRHICRYDLRLTPVFDRNMVLRFVQRTLHDSGFEQRRGAFIRFTMAVVEKLGIAGLIPQIPVSCQPIIACAIQRD